jgi:integrase
MASLVRAGKKWKVYWCHKLQRSSRTFDSKTLACEFMAQEEYKKTRKAHTILYEPESAKYAIYLSRFSKNTQKLYRSVHGGFFKQLPVPVNMISKELVRSWITRQTVSNRTINSRLTAILSYFKWAAGEFGFCNPIQGMSLLRERPPVDRYLSLEQFRSILLAGNEMFRQRALFLANTGLRASEFCNLRWRPCNTDDENYGWVVLEQNHLQIIGKGLKRRIVPLNAVALEILKALLGKRTSMSPPSEFVFLSSDGKRLTRFALRQQFAKVAEKSGIACCAHAMRHLFTHQAAASGLPLASIARMLGHSSSLLTEKVYSHTDRLSVVPVEIL